MSSYTIVAMPILIVSDLLRLGLIIWEAFPGRRELSVVFETITLPARWLLRWLPYDASNVWLTELEIVCILCINAYIWATVIVIGIRILTYYWQPLRSHLGKMK